jgi:anti-sigma factor RsiW
MSEPPISEEMLNAFVDRQLAPEDRLRILRRIADEGGLGQEICERHRMKELLSLAYNQHALPVRPARQRGSTFWRWWRRAGRD